MELSSLMNEGLETPFYCFDADIFAERVKLLRQRLGGRVKICYSLKANPWFVKVALHVCDHIEVCSGGELQICLDAGVPLERISVGGVSKTEAECQELAIHPPHRISVESVQQFRMLKKFSARYQEQLNILLRLTSGNQFGMPLETAIELAGESKVFPYMQVTGIHYYPGTQNRGFSNAQKHIDTLKYAADRLKLREIQFGPGFGAALFAGQNGVEYEAYLDGISENVMKLVPEHDVIIECGRYLTYPAGTYTTTVLDVKEQNGRCYLIVDGGIHQISYYGQINGKPQPMISGMKAPRNRETKCCTVCGSLCTASDILAKDVLIPEPETGDRLVFANVGAYSVTEARSLFLSRDLPAIVLKDKNTFTLVRKASETFRINETEGM